MNRINISFAVIMATLVSVFVLFLFFPPSMEIFSSQKSILFLEGKDWFADFFNVMRYMSDDAGFYYSKINEADGHSGFPIGLGIMYPLTQLANYSEMSLQDCWVSKSAIFSCVAFLTVLVFLLWDSLSRLCEKYHVKKFNLLIFLFSSSFIFTLERANSIFLSASLVNYFLVYYDHVSAKLRYFALMCICLAATLKGYPVLFGLLLLREKRFKDILFCIVFTTIIAFVPFMFMERGFDNLSKMVENTGYNNASYIYAYKYMFGLHKLVYVVCQYLQLKALEIEQIISRTRIVETSLALLSFVLVLAEKRFYRQCLLIVCSILLLPINSGFYCSLYLLPVIIIFFSQRECSVMDYFMMLLFCLVINPLQVMVPYPQIQNLTPFVSNVSLILLWFTLILSTLPALRGGLRSYFSHTEIPS